MDQPPARWGDAEEDTFHRELSGLASRFKHLESIVFGKERPEEFSEAFRLSLTRSDGTPVNAVLGFTNMMIKLLADLRADQAHALTDARVRPHRRFARRGWVETDLESADDVSWALRWLRRAYRASAQGGTEAGDG